jgi:hypothetical protein
MKYIISDHVTEGGHASLVPLRLVIERLKGITIRFWFLREITFSCTDPFFGTPVSTVESMSRRLSGGLGMTDQDFRALLRTDFQLIDGYIDAYGDDAHMQPVLLIECIDSAQWEIRTSVTAIDTRLRDRGLVEAADDGDGKSHC